MFTKILNFILNRKIKGNINVVGEKIYYTPDHRLYNFVVAEKWFRTKKAAEKAGFRKPLT